MRGPAGFGAGPGGVGVLREDGALLAVSVIPIKPIEAGNGGHDVLATRRSTAQNVGTSCSDEQLKD